jgi:vacuolar iron transporter family protein
VLAKDAAYLSATIVRTGANEIPGNQTEVHPMQKSQVELHRTNRVGWLRAAVLGANDGLLSTASLVLGVAAAHGTHGSILIAGTAGLVAGSMSMAAGEYVSVHSQADTEKADLQREKAELANDSVAEQQELAAIYIGRGLDRDLASQVATQLMAHNALEAHARDELGITDALSARPIQAALISALSFAVGAVVPLLVVGLSPETWLLSMVAVTSLVCLAVLGGVAARIGGAAVIKGALRVMFWGVLAMGITTGVGIIFGTKV